MQMLVILFIDEDNNIRYPGLFCLLNNKKYKSYLLLFKRIKNIITVDNTKKINLISYTVDYELLEAVRNTFKEPRTICCYYHYCRNLYAKAINYYLFEDNIE